MVKKNKKIKSKKTSIKGLNIFYVHQIFCSSCHRRDFVFQKLDSDDSWRGDQKSCEFLACYTKCFFFPLYG